MKLLNSNVRSTFAAILLTSLLAGCISINTSRSGPGVETAESSMSEQEANRQFALAFYRPGITIEERDAMIHDGYVQHNPAAVKFAEEQGINAKVAFPLWMARIRAGGGEGPVSEGPEPPAGKQAYMAIAEGDKVFLMHQRFAQDPNEPPGTFYEYFSWGMFGFKDGLIYEHWDGNVINPE
jgi:predicted SnoaL-like aldol condensation-catalyzing enzyme